jgi:endonuclease/exonuclease/phosphatase family metal-dependent hydrolase
MLTHLELAQLAEAVPAEPLKGKLIRLFTTPFVSNEANARGVRPLKPQSAELGRFLRVAFWNIERGLQYESIVAAFMGEERFAGRLERTDCSPEGKELSGILQQVQMLQQADVVVLNEVDLGLPRTRYRNVIETLAEALGMNYAYGVEFIYPRSFGAGGTKQTSGKAMLAGDDGSPAESDVYKGLHGNAILSRYPLENIRLMPLDYPFSLSEGNRNEHEEMFLQNGVRRARRGGRTVLLADIADPDIPGGKATVVSTHLDALTEPRTRRQQLQRLLSYIQDVRNPVILAGDMNTVSLDATPLALWSRISKETRSGDFWLRRGLSYVIGVGLILEAALVTARHFRILSDPTVSHIPLIAPNAEAKFFQDLEEFRFSDGGAFDFRGDRKRSADGRKAVLSNSNQRGQKGFTATFELNRTIGPFGKFKLDWIFVKPPQLTEPRDTTQRYRFSPHFGRTLNRLNSGGSCRISDHHPLLVDLPLQEPPLNAK